MVSIAKYVPYMRTYIDATNFTTLTPLHWIGINAVKLIRLAQDRQRWKVIASEVRIRHKEEEEEDVYLEARKRK